MLARWLRGHVAPRAPRRARGSRAPRGCATAPAGRSSAGPAARGSPRGGRSRRGPPLAGSTSCRSARVSISRWAMSARWSSVSVGGLCRAPQHRTLDVLHDVERRAHHGRVLAQRHHRRDRHRGGGQRGHDAVLAGHVVGGGEHVAERRPPDHPVVDAVGDPVGQVGLAAGDQLRAQLRRTGGRRGHAPRRWSAGSPRARRGRDRPPCREPTKRALSAKPGTRQRSGLLDPQHALLGHRGHQRAVGGEHPPGRQAASPRTRRGRPACRASTRRRAPGGGTTSRGRGWRGAAAGRPRPGRACAAPASSRE